VHYKFLNFDTDNTLADVELPMLFEFFIGFLVINWFKITSFGFDSFQLQK
jgi:hypothetical protein